MRSLLLLPMRCAFSLGIALLAGSLAQAQRDRGPLFPRLHARFHPQPCVPTIPCCPPIIILPVATTLPIVKAAEPAKTYEYVTLVGAVRWPGDRPEPTAKFANNGVRPMPGFGVVVLNDLMIEPTTHGVKNVMVWLRPDVDDRAQSFPFNKIKPELRDAGPLSTLHTIDLKDGNFEPRVLAARAGDRLRFFNNSPVGINVNYSSDIESFNILLPSAGEKKLSKSLEYQRPPIAFACNVHPWLQGRFRVFDHPYFAVTDEFGHFEIRGVPAGRWRIVYAHEHGYHRGKAGVLGFPIEVKNDKAIVVLDNIPLDLPTLPK